MTDRTDDVLEWKPRSVHFGSFLNWGVLWSIPSALLVALTVGSPLLALSLLVVLAAYVWVFRTSHTNQLRREPSRDRRRQLLADVRVRLGRHRGGP